jgi:CxxC motif-containing protein (DUF1111 family)
MPQHARALTLVAALVIVACTDAPPSTAPPAPQAPDSAAPDFDVMSGAPDFGEPLANLTPDELARFDAGLEEFLEEEEVDGGLGPVFNEAACATCHNNPVGGTTGRTEARFGRVVNGAFDPMTEHGGSLIQDQGIGLVSSGGDFTFVGEVVHPTATVTAARITTQLFGLGLVDAVPDNTLLQLARLQAALTPATAGTPNLVREIRTGRTRVGRFGWKAQVPTLFQFSGDAYLNEMGITNPEFPDENCPQGDCAALAHNPLPDLNDDGAGVVAFTDFMTLLAAPPRGPSSLLALQGKVVFARIGCANCHTPVLVTGESPVAALSKKAFQPFSDFLLHDMGVLGDGIVQGSATGRQMRTAPLWGLRTRSLLLHDGRATTIPQAIRFHAGQGAASRNRFLRLSWFDRYALLRFLKTL